MAALPQINYLGRARNASLTDYLTIGSSGTGFSLVSAEAQTQVPVRAAGTYSLLSCYVTATTVSNASTLKFRKNTANGNLSVSLTGSTTGLFQDATNTDTIIAGDLCNCSLVTGSTGASMTIGTYSILFAASSNTAANHINNGQGAGIVTASVTRYMMLNGQLENVFLTTETLAQYKVRSAGTLKNLAVYVSANTRTATTFGSRKNTAAGALTLSVGSSATGLFEDTTHSDTLVAGDLTNYFLTTGTGTNNLSPSFISSEFDSTSGVEHLVVTNHGSTTHGASLTRYYPVGGALDGGLGIATTESTVYSKALTAFTASNLIIHLSANTVSATSTLNLRKNGANTTNTASITASTTGFFEDVTHTDSIIATDDLNYQLIAAAAGTSLTPNFMGILMTAPAVVVTYFGNFFSFFYP